MHFLSLPLCTLVLIAGPAILRADTIDLPSRAYREQIERATPAKAREVRLRVQPVMGMVPQNLRGFEPSPAFLRANPELISTQDAAGPAARFAQPIRLSIEGASIAPVTKK